MLSALALALALCLSPASAAPSTTLPSRAASAAAPEDKFTPAQDEFVRRSASGTFEQKKNALATLVGLGDPRAAGVLIAEFSRAATELEALRKEARDTSYALERREVVVANLRAELERNPGVRDQISREEQNVADLRRTNRAAVEKRDELAPWVDELSAGFSTLLKNAPAAAKAKLVEQAAQDADEHPDWGVRAASVELIGRVAAPGAALQIIELIERAHAERAKLESKLRKSMGDVRKMEARLQEESAKNEGRISAATVEQYDRAKREASEVRSTQTRIDAFVLVAERAGGRALGAESGKELDKSLARLMSAVAKPKPGSRLSLLSLLGHTGGEAVRVRVRAQLESEKDAAGLAMLLEGVAALRDTALEALVIEKHLQHPEWLVRASAAATLAKLRSKAAIEPLINRLDKEEGRLRTDVRSALASLTGQDFNTNATLWRRWWKDNAASFVVPPEAPPKTSVEAAEEQRGVSFFGISTESQRVLFILDLSGSMKFSMSPKNNPTDDPSKPYDMPGAGESSRLDAAKRDLIKAIGGLRDGARFNLVLFGSDVWTWDDELVEMSPEKRAALTKYIEQVEAVGATNIYGALERAFDAAGAKGGDTFTNPTIDTIYLLTDGKATVGVTIERDEILAFVRSRNQSAGITIHTIGLSDAHDAVLMRRIAEENGGQYVGR
ncbi:MAG: VWA domain-containing protein [Planctomycetes bacterium]|nr:VWA domain-containing protein [Planctomycetota bacterium]